MSVAEIFETMAYGPAPESAIAARQWLEQHGPALDLLIDNHMVAPRCRGIFRYCQPRHGHTPYSHRSGRCC